MSEFQLRPIQEKAIQKLREGWKQHRTHLVYATCAFGKTALAYHITKGFVQAGKRVMFVAPYTTLVEQTAARFMEYGLDQPSIIWRDHEWYDPYNLVQIASADTLVRRDMPDIDILIVDECQIKRKKLLEIIENADFPVIGLSGTPFPKWLGTYYSNLVKVCTMREMIDQGLLSDFDLYAPTKPDMTGVKTSHLAGYGKDYVENQVAEIMADATIVGDVVKTWLKLGENEPTIVFCCNILHAGKVTNEFNKFGVTAEIITGKTPMHERRGIFKRYGEGITKVICNVGVLVAGFDADVRCISYCRPTFSEIRWIQCLARGLRTAPGKKRCIILDHSGSVFRLGFPDTIEYTRLLTEEDGMKDESSSAREEVPPEKVPKECSKCHFMKKAGQYQCPRCGHRPLAGEDVEVDESRDLKSLKSVKVATMEEKGAFFQELKGYQAERAANGKPISDGWCSNTYKSKFSTWPKGHSQTPKTPTPETRNYIKHLMIKFAKSKAKKK